MAENLYDYRLADFVPIKGLWDYHKRTDIRYMKGNKGQNFEENLNMSALSALKIVVIGAYNFALGLGALEALKGIEKLVR